MNRFCSCLKEPICENEQDFLSLSQWLPDEFLVEFCIEVINSSLCDNSLYNTLLFNSHWASVNVSSAFCRHPQFDNHTWAVCQNLVSGLPRQHLGFTFTGIFELSATVLLSRNHFLFISCQHVYSDTFIYRSYGSPWGRS